ncbi:MAG: hypothetical protein JSU95_15800 [Betaproteobacteria bacterium]|nr:MAG: hypothetical protein JSU95_15800 [Betaproteobacteria bacterium]
MKSLAKEVGAAVDAAFADSSLSDFAPVADVHGDILRRYYRGDETAEFEVCVYRDKWWTKAGGTVHADLYCLVSKVQQALGGFSQSWLKPDYGLPLEHFQYGLGKSAKDLSQEIRSDEDATRFAEKLSQFLLETGLAWFGQFYSREGTANYLLGEENFHGLARYRAHLGDHDGSWTALKQYLEGLPRQNEQENSRRSLLSVCSWRKTAACSHRPRYTSKQSMRSEYASGWHQKVMATNNLVAIQTRFRGS